jgi:hypothetical protein
MAEHDPKTAAPAGLDMAATGFTTATKNMQALASEMAQMSRHSFEQTTKVMDKLRNARTLEEVVAIQAEFWRDSLETFAEQAQRLGGLLAGLPLEMAKSTQEVMEKAAEMVAQTTKTAQENASNAMQSWTDTTPPHS